MAAGAACLLSGALVGATAARAQGNVPSGPPAGSTVLALPPSPLLPAQLGRLSRVAQGDAGDGLGELNGAGFDPTVRAVLTEDGIKRYAQSDYSKGETDKGGALVETVTVYKFVDASGALSAYDFFRKTGMRAVKLGDAAVANADELVVRSGVDVARIVLKSRTRGEAWGGGADRELVDHLPKVGGNAAILPLLPTLVPARGLDADTVKYALGPAGYAASGGVLPAESVGFDKSAETVTAKYKGQGTLTLALYPTPQIAGDHARAAQTDLKNQGAAAGTVMLRREGPLVVFTTGAWKPDAAEAMVEGIHLRQEISFDKPMPHEFHAEVQKTYTLLQSIAVFCVAGAVAAIILGLFFGGGRALIRVLQGKPAATEPEFLRIDLRGPAQDTPPQK